MRHSAEEIRRSAAYHEAAHAVVGLTEGHTLRYVSIWTEGTDYRDICVSAVNYQVIPGVGDVPVPQEALGHAIASIAGTMAESRAEGKNYPWDTWEKIIEYCEELEECNDPDLLEDDFLEIREYCEGYALFGQMLQMPKPDELSEDAPSLWPVLSVTAKEAFELALEAAEHRVNGCWSEIEDVAEKLMQDGYLSGDEVTEIVFGSAISQEETM